MKIKRYALNAKKNFVLMKIIKNNSEKREKSDIIAIIQENIGELLIAVVI